MSKRGTKLIHISRREDLAALEAAGVIGQWVSSLQTETVYGLGPMPIDGEAVRIFAAKGRPVDNPHCACAQESWPPWLPRIPAPAAPVSFWPGP